ncbi:MAG TPA: hypothetical protein VLS90_17410 [Thermodesulfobacteriota bacterium]|nr:hypothetical protein [Thermodesulfobacteriota bacterium]
MDQRELQVEIRNGKGKGAARRLRREGKIPAVLYGGKIETFSLAVNPDELRKILSSGAVLTGAPDEAARDVVGV